MKKRAAVIPSNAKLDSPTTFALPYATGVRAGDFIFLSGLIAIDPATGERAHGSTAGETALILSNMAKILEGAGSSLGQVVKTTVWLHSMLEQEDMALAYRPFFPDAPPARTVCGAKINHGMKVQIDCIALAGD
jgi:enamine deaminase RidA (YjgF/YER057c/UK114 family)